MQQPTTIGIDLAKNVFQVHGVDAAGAAVLKRKLRRSRVLAFFERLEPCLVGMEACAGAHFWGRALQALGHEVRIMPPSYVKAYVKRGKTDAADAEAICEAVTRPTMRFVPVKSAERQAALLDHKARDFLVRQRTQLVNTIRAHLSEFGIVVAKGIHNVDRLLEAVEDLPPAARPAVDLLADQLRETQARIDELTERIEASQRTDPLARRLATIPGVGALTASAIAATTPEVDNFRSARDYAAWLGLTPQPHSSGGKGETATAIRPRERSNAGPHLESRQPIPPAAAVPRRDGADQRAAVRTARHGLVVAHAGEKAREGRRDRARQSDGAPRLGAHPHGRKLQGRHGLTEPPAKTGDETVRRDVR